MKTDLGVIVKEPATQAELLYGAVFRADAGQPVPALPIPPVMMGTPVFTPFLGHKELSNLDISKSPGPDQLRPKLHKWLATFIAGCLADLLNKSLAAAVVQGDWKAAVICQIFKKGT